MPNIGDVVGVAVFAKFGTLLGREEGAIGDCDGNNDGNDVGVKVFAVFGILVGIVDDTDDGILVGSAVPIKIG